MSDTRDRVAGVLLGLAAGDQIGGATRMALRVGESLLSPSGFAPDALHAAVHFVATATSFPEALERSLEFAGPANYSPVLVGSIGGARWGSSAVEERLVAHHGESMPRVLEAATGLASGWPHPG